MVLMEGRYCTTELLKLVIFSNKELKSEGTGPKTTVSSIQNEIHVAAGLHDVFR
jgi:hypothetical protein